MKKQNSGWVRLAAIGAVLCLMSAMALSQNATSKKISQHELSSQRESATVLLISLDGLRPDAVLQASVHGLKVPNLTRMVRQGASASGVRGVLPTVTYPSHTTLITGASPAAHGIETNTTFDPFNRNQQGWYWYAEDIKVPTLWDAAHKAGLTTANVHWPVSVGAAAIDYNLPQIWRTGMADDLKLQRALETPRLEASLSASLGPYPQGKGEDIDDDEKRARFAVEILQTKHPAFMTVYLCGLDTEEHHSGPFSAAANAVLERLDRLVGQLRAAAESAAPGRAYVAVVSDHGFAAVHDDVNLYEAFLQAGLFRVDAADNIVSWDAMPWPAGGSAAIMLRDAQDRTTAAKVDRLLVKLAADPANGIERVLSKKELQQSGGFAEAESFVAFRLGYELGFNFTGPLVSAPPHYRGMHGYLASHDEMLSTFFLTGPGVKAAKNLGIVDMRQIAPTLGQLLGVSLDAAEKGPVDWR